MINTKVSGKALLIPLVFFATFSTQAKPIKVACIGDSITQGIGVVDPMLHSYPAILGKILGSGYRVENFGYSGTTVLKAGNNPYWKTTAFRDAIHFDPKIVVIALGTNDSKTINWDGREAQFGPDYEALISRFEELSTTKPRIFLCLPPPSFRPGDGIREHILVRQRGIIQKIASHRKLTVIDFYTTLKNHREWLTDGVHPNELGTKAIAATVAQTLTK